jgi:hypothetical protein
MPAGAGTPASAPAIASQPVSNGDHAPFTSDPDLDASKCQQMEHPGA